MNRQYKNWIYFVILPLAFILLIEVLLGWPYNGKIVAESAPRYIEVTVTLSGLVLFGALVGLGVNFWHYKRMPEDKRLRSIHMVISVALLCIDYILGKIMLLLTTMTYEQFVSATGIRYVNTQLVEKSVSGVLLIFFLFQCLFALLVLMRRRKQMQEPRS